MEEEKKDLFEILKKSIEKNLAVSKFLAPVAMVFPLAKDVIMIGIDNIQVDDETAAIDVALDIEKLINIITLEQAYKVILVHEYWKIDKPEKMTMDVFRETLEESLDTFDKTEGYTIAELTREGAKVFTRSFSRKGLNKKEEEIVFAEDGAIHTNIKLDMYSIVQEALAVMN
jgi:hypothetical protein